MPHNKWITRVCSRNTKVSCNLCDKSFKGDVSFRLHAKIYHPGFTFSFDFKIKADNNICSKCRKRFYTLEECSRHLRSCRRCCTNLRYNI